MAKNDDGYAFEMQEDDGGHGDVMLTPIAKEEIKDITGSLGKIHMVLAWLRTFLEVYKPGADEAGTKTEGRDGSPSGFIFIEGQSSMPKPRSLRFQCMYCPLTKLLRSFNNGGTMSFDIDVSKHLGRPFTFSNPVLLRFKSKTMEVSDEDACADHNGCLMHRLFKTVIGGVNSLFQVDPESLCSKVKLPDQTEIPKIELMLKILQEAHLNALKRLRGLTVEEEAHFNALRSLLSALKCPREVARAVGVGGAAGGTIPGPQVIGSEIPAGGAFLNVLQQLSRENRQRIAKILTDDVADKLTSGTVEAIEAILAGAAGSASSNTRSAKGVRPSVRSGGGSVQRQDEENRVLKVLEDLHAWPMQVVEEVEVSQVVEEVEVSQLMGALSLSANARARDESVVFPLLVVRVLQGGERLAATQVGSDFRLYEVDEGKIIKVVLVNLSQRDVDMWPVYVGEKEEGEKFGSVTFDQIRIAPGGRKDVPKPEFPGLQKALGETEEAWVLKDESGTSLLKLRFVLKET